MAAVIGLMGAAGGLVRPGSRVMKAMIVLAPFTRTTARPALGMAGLADISASVTTTRAPRS